MTDIDNLCVSVDVLSVKQSTLDCFIKTIASSKYVTSCTSKRNKDPSSISSVIDRILSQSDCIKVGIAIEDVLRLFVSTFIKNINDIKGKNIKGKKEKDHLFCDETSKIIYFAEIKANLNLDTEKCRATVKKCIDIHDELSLMYPNYTVKTYLVGARYLHSIDINKTILKKYDTIKNSIVGINDYIMKLGYEGEPLTDEEYCFFLNRMTDNMFEK
jgi:hypothetical protein